MNRFQKVIARLLGMKGDMSTAGMSRAFSLTDHDMVRRFGGGPTYSGKTVGESAAMQVTVAWACVRIITETVGSLPLAVFERDPVTGNAKKIDHDLSDVLISTPNADMTGVEYRETIGSGLALRGNSYALKETRTNGSIISLYPFQSYPTRNRDTGEVEYPFTDRGKTENLPREKVWHIKGFGSDGFAGLSPIAHARQTLGVSLSAEEFQARFFAQGANPSYLITIPEWLEPEQREIARENINRIWSGLDNMHRAQLLEGGMTATAATMPLEDAQFLELRGFGLQEICRIYLMPPHKVADLARSTNNNIEHQGTEFVTSTLMPYLTRIEASAARWLLPLDERRRFFVRFNVDAHMRADATGRAAIYNSALQNGWLSRNEVRALENRNSVEGLDGFTAQVNLAPIDRILAGDTLKLAASGDAPRTAPEKATATEERRVVVQLPDALKKLFGVEGDSVDEVAVKKIMARVALVQEESAASAAQFREGLARVAQGSDVQASVLKSLADTLAALQAAQRQNREIAFRELGLDDSGKPRVSH